MREGNKHTGEERSRREREGDGEAQDRCIKRLREKARQEELGLDVTEPLRGDSGREKEVPSNGLY